MELSDIQYCALPECNKPFKNWRSKCCCRSHRGKYAAKARHGTLDQPNKTSEEIRIANREKKRIYNEFIGPRLPATKRSYTRYGTYKKSAPLSDNKSKSIEQRRSEWVAYVVNRRRKRDQSMPSWSDKEKITSFYIKARELTKLTGTVHEVDHVIPSNHPLVCGLHNEFNLQVLTRQENRIKSNKFDIEAFNKKNF